ncbi:MAG: efflux RND transporter permease subunit [bacterium]|nr:efflux RND transporter permease subunit [bacterium]
MRKLIQFFIDRPIWGNASIVIIIMFGLFSLFTTNRSFFPEEDPKRVIISVTYPGASPSEMEEGITIKIEQAIRGFDGVDEIRSSSQENFAQITVIAEDDADMEQLFNDIDNAVNSISSFPAGTEPPTITMPKAFGMGSIVAFVGVSAKDENADIAELIDVSNEVETALLNTESITEIEKSGFPEKEIVISAKEQELIRYNVSLSEIAQAIRTKNIDITTGVVRGSMEEMNIRSNNRSTDPKDIEEIVLRTTPKGELIHIGDVADVEITYAEQSQTSFFNGNPSTSFQVKKTPEQDISDITEELHKFKKQFEKENPDYQFNIFFEFNGMLDDRIDLLTRNGIMGLVLVLLFLGLFLNLKLSAWVAFGIPFSFLGMFIFGAMYGITINMISLFGMILVVGILVDDGVVIAENIFTHFERGKKAKDAALDGTMEVLKPVFTSVLTTIVAFSILFFVEGMELIKEMSFVVIACLAFSLFEAFIILPGHLGHDNVLSESKKATFSYLKGFLFLLAGIAVIFLGTRLIPDEFSFAGFLFPFVLIIVGAIVFLMGFTKSPMENLIRGSADKGIKFVRDRWFATTVKHVVGKRIKAYYFTFFIPFLFVVSALYLFGSGIINFTFFPDIQPDRFTIEAAYTPGDSDTRTKEFQKRATQILLEENQRIKEETGDDLLSYYISTIGVSESIGQFGNHTGMINVFFDGENSKTPVDTLINRVNRRLRETPQGKLARSLYVGGEKRFGKPIQLGITSSNDNNLLSARDEIKDSLANMEGVINVKDDMPLGKNEVEVKLRPEASIYGFSEGEVLSQIRQSFFGDEAQRVIVGKDEVKLWVRFDKQDRNSLLDLKRMKIRNLQGTEVELQAIADFEMSRAPETLRRLDGQRIITIDAETTDPDMVANINEAITNEVLPGIYGKYPSIKTVPLGQAKRQGKIAASMKVAGLIGVVIMFIIITLHFNSLSNAFLIMLVIPAGLGGAIIGHGLVGISISIFSFFGIIALIGVLVNDSIVFLDRYNDLLLEGKDVKTAAVEAAKSRFRPILLTSLTTVAGLLPIMSETSMQAQFLIPVAVSIAFGVLFGTIFILVFYPAAILFWNAGRIGFQNVIHGHWRIVPASVEPIIRNTKRKQGLSREPEFYTDDDEIKQIEEDEDPI